MFVNTLTADDKYSRSNMQNLPQQFQTPLCQKGKTFYGFSIVFMKCASKGEHFLKEDKYRSLTTSEILESERGGFLNV